MVGRLNETAALLRRSAEDNAHTFKTPLAIIRQAHDMLRGPLGPERAVAALDAISASLHKLDGLVRSARRLDVATADLLDFARHPMDLSGLVEAFVAERRLMLADHADSLVAAVTPGIVVVGREELVETTLENLVENAVSFSPPGGRIFITLSNDGHAAKLEVADEGPGVPPDRLERIFDRYHSERPPPPENDDTAEQHYGVGLWLVRQNIGALGGKVVAANRPEGGLAVTVTLPIAPKGKS
jgi:two-component system sensor histidine kinase ChvG